MIGWVAEQGRNKSLRSTSELIVGSITGRIAPRGSRATTQCPAVLVRLSFLNYLFLEENKLEIFAMIGRTASALCPPFRFRHPDSRKDSADRFVDSSSIVFLFYSPNCPGKKIIKIINVLTRFPST